MILATCGASMEVGFQLEWRATYFGSLRAKLILALLGMPKWVWPSMNRYRMFFYSILHNTSKHRKFTKHRRCCMQTNKLMTKSLFELEDISNIFKLLHVKLCAPVEACELYWTLILKWTESSRMCHLFWTQTWDSHNLVNIWYQSLECKLCLQDCTGWQQNIWHRLGNHWPKNWDSLLKLQGGVWVQYGVKISLITSFKDTCFIEIAPTEQKSERGLISLCHISLVIKNNILWNGIHLVTPTYVSSFWSVITRAGMV